MTEQQLRPALEQPLSVLCLVVEDLTVVPAGSRRVLRVLVDRDLSHLDAADATSPVPPLTLDEVAEATRAVSDTLDRGDLMGARPYTLEVSSPGVDRPLRGFRAFRRNVGRLVEIALATGESVTARIVAVDDDHVTVQVPAGRRSPAQQRVLALGDVVLGRVQVEFGRPAGAADDPAEDDDADAHDDESEETAHGH